MTGRELYNTIKAKKNNKYIDICVEFYIHRKRKSASDRHKTKVVTAVSGKLVTDFNLVELFILYGTAGFTSSVPYLPVLPLLVELTRFLALIRPFLSKVEYIPLIF